MEQPVKRGPAFLAVAFLFLAVGLSGFFATHQMNAAQGEASTIFNEGLMISILGALVGIGGALWAALNRGSGNRRAALLCYLFGTALFALQIYNFAIHR